MLIRKQWYLPALNMVFWAFEMAKTWGAVAYLNYKIKLRDRNVAT